MLDIRKIGCLIILIILQIPYSVTANASPQVSAKGAVVIDVQSGRVLFDSNMSEKMGMASTTKIMTAVIALEYGKGDDIVTVSSRAAAVEGSSMWLEAGEKVSLADLVSGLMLVSGNDAATAIAEHIGKTEKDFVTLMNNKAKEIGVKNTHFMNPHGLAHDEHYTSAYDLGMITAYALKIPEFREIVSSRQKIVSWEGHEYGRTLNNHNKLLRMYEGCDGVKTGFTKATGRCLVSSATRDGWQIAAVTLNAPDDWADHTAMLNFGFSSFKRELFAKKGSDYGSISVKGGVEENVGLAAAEDFFVPFRENEKFTVNTYLPKQVKAPVKKGDIIGYAGVVIDDIEYKAYPIIARASIQSKAERSKEQAAAFKLTLRNMFYLWIGSK